MVSRIPRGNRGFTLALLAVLAGLAGVWSEGVAETRSTRFLFRGKAVGAFWKQADERREVSATYWATENLLMPGQERGTPFAALGGTMHSWNSQSISSTWCNGPVEPGAVRVRNDLRAASLDTEVPGTLYTWSAANGWASTNVVARVRARLESDRVGPAGVDPHESYSPEQGLSGVWWSHGGRAAVGVHGEGEVRLFGDGLGREGVALLPENTTINWGHVVATERGLVTVEQEQNLAGRGVAPQ